MEARVTKVATVSGRFSKSLARRRLRPEPGESALDNPAARQDDEALHVVAPLVDLRAQRRHTCHRSVNLPGVVAAIGPDQLEPREAPAYLVEDELGPVAVPGSRPSGRRRASAALQCRRGRGFCGTSPACRRRSPLGCQYRPLFRRFDRLAVENRSRGARAHPLAQRHMQLGPDRSQTPSRWNLRKML
jgi:hypothetical protein